MGHVKVKWHGFIFIADHKRVVMSFSPVDGCAHPGRDGGLCSRDRGLSPLQKIQEVKSVHTNCCLNNIRKLSHLC